MAILSFRVSTYARNVYLYGNTKLADISTSPDDYRTATIQYAATHFTREQIDNALTQGWITQAEYDETISYIPVA
jgi:ribulose bisphosphate carboxylase small subunit